MNIRRISALTRIVVPSAMILLIAALAALGAPPAKIAKPTTRPSGQSVAARRGLEELAPGARAIRDIEYSNPGGKRLHMDVYLPAKKPSGGPVGERGAAGPEKSGGPGVPVVMWVHGGAWRAGDKGRPPILPLLRDGFAIASINYRLVPDALFPAQIEDCRAAVRFLRTNASKVGIDGERIAVAGASAGGHLVALLGTQSDHDNEHTNTLPSARVAAVVDYFGPTDLTGIVRRPVKPESNAARFVTDLIGPRLPIEEIARRANDASPLVFVSKDSAPFMIVHGAKDPLVPVDQSNRLHAALTQAGVESTLRILPDASHSGPEFFNDENLRPVAEFLARHLNTSVTTHDR